MSISHCIYEVSASQYKTDILKRKNTLKIEALIFQSMLVTTQQTALCRNPQHLTVISRNVDKFWITAVFKLHHL